MRKLTILFSLICFVFLITCKQEAKQTEPQKTGAEVALELQQVWKDYIEASNSENIDKAMTFFTEDYVNMPIGMTQNKEEVREMLTSYLENTEGAITDYKQLEVFYHGDMAYEFSTLKQEMTPPGGEMVKVNQRCITVFKKDDAGNWKFFRWMDQQ